jgi:hypothetical protein
MTNEGTGYFVLAGVLVLLVIERLSVWFFQKELVSQINFLDIIGIVSVGILFISGIDNPKIIEGIVGEYGSLKEVFYVLGVIGVIGGLSLAFLSIGQGNTIEESAQNSVIGKITASASGGDYTPMNAFLSHPTYGNGEASDLALKFSQTRFSMVGEEMSSISDFLLTFNLNFFHIALPEELAMLAFTALILAGFGVYFKADSGMELLDPFGQIALVIRGLAFGFLHIFAYTNGLESFQLGYFIPAIIGGIFFGALAYWKGLLPAVMAHAVYNTTLDVVFATGWTFIVSQFGLVILIFAGMYAIWDLVIKDMIGME